MGKDIGSSGVYQTPEEYGSQQYSALQTKEAQKLRRQLMHARLLDWGRWHRSENRSPMEKAAGQIKMNTIGRLMENEGANSIKVSVEGEDRLLNLEVSPEYHEEQDRLAANLDNQIRETLEPMTIVLLEIMYVDGFSFQQIADELDVSTKTVSRMKSKAIDDLK